MSHGIRGPAYHRPALVPALWPPMAASVHAIKRHQGCLGRARSMDFSKRGLPRASPLQHLAGAAQVTRSLKGRSYQKCWQIDTRGQSHSSLGWGEGAGYVQSCLI